MTKFKKLNYLEYLGLISILEEPFPWINENMYGNQNNNLKKIKTTITENSPNSKYCLLGAFGVNENNDIILQYHDYKEENKTILYSIKMSDANVYRSLSLVPWNSYLKKINK